MHCSSDKKNKKDISKIIQHAQSLFYKKLVEGLTKEERQAINANIEQKNMPVPLGKEITKATFNFICPESSALLSAEGFNVHGNINPDTGEIEAIITVDCKSCKNEHPVTIISFPEMLSMPFIDE